MLGTEAEHEKPVEREQIIAERVQTTLDHYREIGAKIDHKTWEFLLPQIIYQVNLDEHEIGKRVKEEHALDYLYALVKQNGEVLVGDKFFEQSEYQQQHTLSHELGHRLDWFGRQLTEEDPGFEQITALLELVQNLPPEQASRYVQDIDERLKGKNENGSDKILRESLAELYAQYLESDGSFGGMFRAKIQSYTGQEQPAWLDYADADHFFRDIDQLDQCDETTRETYFQHYPDLKLHYQIYEQIDRICQNQEIIGGIVEPESDQYDPFDDYDFMEYEMLSSQVPAQEPARLAPTTPTKNIAGQTSQPNSVFPDWFRSLFG